MPDHPPVTDADREAAERLHEMLGVYNDDADAGFPITDTFTESEMSTIIARAMAPERERAARMEKALRGIMENIKSANDLHCTAFDGDCQYESDLEGHKCGGATCKEVRSAILEARAALGEE